MAEKTQTNIMRFRTVWGGFHKQDVTEYLVKTSTAHRNELERLNERIARLEAENEKLRLSAPDLERMEELKAENGRLTERIRLLEDQLAQATAALEEATEAASEQNLRELELEAYRRAEAMERRANERFRSVSAQVERISGDVTCQMAESLESAKGAISALEEQLTTLHTASAQLDAAMSGGVEKLEALASAFTEVSEDE